MLIRSTRTAEIDRGPVSKCGVPAEGATTTGSERARLTRRIIASAPATARNPRAARLIGSKMDSALYAISRLTDPTAWVGYPARWERTVPPPRRRGVRRHDRGVGVGVP